MTLLARQDVTTSDGSTPEGGVYITVKLNGAVASIFDSNGNAQANPFQSANDGSFSYYVTTAGTYTEEYRFNLGDTPRTVETVSLSAIGAAPGYASRSAIAALTPISGQAATLTESGREGTFVFDSSNLSAKVTADPQQGIYIAPSSDTTGASGAWVRKGARATPYMFGAVGDGVTDDHVALQAFNDWFFASVRTDLYADFTGNFGCSQKPLIGPGTPLPDNRVIHYNVGGELYITALAPLNEIVSPQNLAFTVWNGRITGWGQGGAAFSSRTCVVGVMPINCQNARFTGGLRGFNTMLHGAYLPSSGAQFNDCMQLGAVTGIYCGSGPVQTPSQCLTANWSSPVNNGAAGSVLQTTTLTVDTLPPVALDAYITWGTDQAAVWINEHPYKITAIDRVNSKITIGYWLDSAVAALGSGTLTYIFGAAYAAKGSDSGIVKVDHIECLNCGIGVGDGQLYGSRIASANIESTTVAVALGPIGATHEGSSLDAVYSLDNVKCHVLQFGASNGTSYLKSGYLTDVTKMWSLNGARDAQDRVQTSGQFNNLGIAIAGRQHAYVQPQTANSLPAGITLSVSSGPVPQFYNSNQTTLHLTNAANGKWNTLLGYAGGVVWITGTGANGAPTGIITVTPPTMAITGCSIVSGNATVTVPITGIARRAIAVGMPVSGTGIPAGATVATVASGGTSFTIDAGHLPTETNANVTLTFTGSVNGSFANVTFTGFEGPAGFQWVHTDSYEMVWSVLPISGKRPAQVVQTNSSTSYNPSLADHATLKRMTATTAITIPLPSDATLAFPVGSYIDFAQENTGVITFTAGSGATVQSRGGLVNSNGLHAVVRATKSVANTWLLTGDRA